MPNCTRCGFELSPASVVCAACRTAIPRAPRAGLIVGSIIGAIYLCVIGMVITAYFYVSRHPHFAWPFSSTAFVPGGPDNSNALGIALYPGQRDMYPRIQRPSNRMATTYYATDDSIEQVKAFYLKKYGNSVSVSGDAHSATLAFRLAEHDSVMLTVTNHSVPAETVTHLFYSRMTTGN